MKTHYSAIIPAAGLGRRLGRGPKGLLEICGRKLLDQLLDTLSPLVDEVIIGIPSGYQEEFNHFASEKVKLFPGGKTRQETIELLLRQTTRDIILIQDAARPFVRAVSIIQVVEAATQYGAAGLFLDPSVPVAKIKDGFAIESFSRDAVGIFQAPQAFRKEVLLDAIGKTQGKTFQSTVEMVLAAGYRVKSIEGDPCNIKITNEFDFGVAEKIIMKQLEK